MSPEAKLAQAVASSLPRKFVKLGQWRAAVARLPAPGNALDIGTGYGGITSFLAGEGKWTFLDIEPERLKVAGAFLRGELVCESASTFLPKHPRHFDRIHMVDCIFYFPDWADLLGKIGAALAPGGRLVLSGMESHPGDPLMRLRESTGVVSAVGAVARIDCADLHVELARYGFVIEREYRYLGPFAFFAQTLVDLALLRSTKSQSEGLTYRIEKQGGSFLGKRVALFVVRQFSRFLRALDTLTPFFPRYAYLIVARKG